jgi:hypothetical protein
LHWRVAVLRSPSFLALSVVLGVLTVRGARAEGERPSHCASFALGFGGAGFSGDLPVLDEEAQTMASAALQFAYCGAHFDLGGAVQVAGYGGSAELMTVTGRLHTKSPVGIGVEAGIGARAGVAHMYLPSGYTDDYDYWHGWGPTAAAGPDVRVWLGDTAGLFAGFDLIVGAVAGSEPYEPSAHHSERFTAYQGTFGTVLRF